MINKYFNSKRAKFNKLTLIRISRNYQRSSPIIEWDKFADSILFSKNTTN